MAERKQVVCLYQGHRRELCPIILGHTKGEEPALTYRFAGGGSGDAPLPQWKCLQLVQVSEVELRDGPWRAGSSHRQRQACVADVEFDIDPSSPYHPRRKLQ